MEKKLNWKKYFLNIILKTSFLVFIFACTITEIDNEFIYKNESNHNLEIIIYQVKLDTFISNYFINKGEEFSINESMITNGSDSLAKIIFDNEKVLIHTHSRSESIDCQTPNSLYCLESFIENRHNKHSADYIYTFTEEDYDNAEDCNGNCN